MGETVVTGTEEAAKQTIAGIEETHPGAKFIYEKFTYETPGLFGLFSNEKEGYKIMIDTENNNYDFSQDKYSRALFDILVVPDITFEIFFTEPGALQANGGGYNPIRKENYSFILIDPQGYKRIGEPFSVILMHELVGHNHPVARPKDERYNAHDINKYYMKKLGLERKADYRYPHYGYSTKEQILGTLVKWDKKYINSVYKIMH